ncbi:MAG TPA: MFS transporter [Caulobacteraceae bacterium]|jgi:putative MFS transporter
MEAVAPAGHTIAERLDRLPACRYIWTLIALISFGAFFEIYDIFLSAPLSLGLVAAGLFQTGKGGLFGFADQASFIAATFAGLWLGALVFSAVADRMGRRPIFTIALLWYALATCVMAFQTNNLAIDAWRLIASVGVGVELVAIDCYITELTPKGLRGRAFAVSAAIQFLSVPLLSMLAWRLIPGRHFGLDGWRWLALLPAIAAAGAWSVRRRLPESPRWLAEHGRAAEAEEVMAMIETRVVAELGRPLSQLQPRAAVAASHAGLSPSLFAPPWRRRTLTLIVFHLLQTLGYYGFANWLPTLLVAQGVELSRSLAYGVALALVPPAAPLVFLIIADRFERKWLIVAGALTAAAFGLAMAAMTATSSLVLFTFVGMAVAGGSSLMSLAYHAYQSELFPTAIRARAVGFVYSFSRLSAAISSYLIAWTLAGFGGPGVFVLIAGALAGTAAVIALFGPRTRGLALEEI